jgi:hypothetical protein
MAADAARKGEGEPDRVDIPDQLASLTGLPRGLWVFLFALVAACALVLGARLLVPWPPHLPSVGG